MKANKTLIMLTTAAMIVMGSLLAFAQDYNAGTEPAAAQHNDAGTESAAGQSVSQVQVHGVVEKTEVQVHGVVEKTDHGITLFDGKTTYLLKSENDLDPFAGKTVTVTGYGYSSDTGMVILVDQIAELS